MMMWPILLFTLICVVNAQEGISAADFEQQLYNAAQEVLGEHADEMSSPPHFETPPNFMRSFVPNTGIGNREELIIERIQQVPVSHDSNFTKFRYKRFNNTDYLLGWTQQNAVLHILKSTGEDFISFTKDDAVFNFVADNWSTITDVTLFTRLVKHSLAMYVAILTESTRTSLVNIYEVAGNKGILVAVVDLSISHATGPVVARKLEHVESQHGESLIVLLDAPGDSQVVYQQKGSSPLNHYIEVYLQNAANVATFTVHGHGYIAVANSTTCHVYKLDEFARGHLLFDRLFLPHGDIVGIEYFRLGFHQYLTVAGRFEQHLYSWRRGEFSLQQVFEGHNVQQLFSMPLPTCRDDVLLFSIQDDTEIYIYSGKHENFVKSIAVIPQNFRPIPGSVTYLNHKNEAVVLFLNHNADLVAFVIETRLEEIPHPVLKAREDVSTYMIHVQNMLEQQTKQVQHIREVLQNAVRKDGEQHITAYQTFANIHSTNGTVVEGTEGPIIVQWNSSDLTIEEYKAGTEQLARNIAQLEKLVQDIENIIPDVVRTNENAFITGAKRFVGDVSGSSILAESVYLDSVAGINLPELQNDLYRLDKPQQIQGTLFFDKPLTVTGNLDIEGTLNGIKISRDVMTTDTDQDSYAQMNFKNKFIVNGDITMSGKLNNIDPKDIVTLTGSHHITGKKNFTNGLIAENVQTHVIDGVDIDDIYERALLKSTEQKITGIKTFSGGLVTNNIELRGTLNGYDVAELANSIVRVDEFAEITGHKTFEDDVIIEGPLTVGGKVNGLRIPDDLFLADVPQDVTGDKHFVGTVTANHVTVAGKVDGLSIPEDVITLTGDEEIPGTVYFTNGISVDGDIHVKGLVDGLDISEVSKEALTLDDTSRIKNAVFHGPVTITDNMVVKGTVNKVNLDKLVKDVVFKDDKDIVIEGEKHFKNVKADKVQLHRSINGYNIAIDFMTVHGDQVINGTKIFKDKVVFNSIDIGNGLIGGLNVTQLVENRLSLIIEEEIEEDIQFKDHVIVEGNLVVHGTIGGLRIPQDVVLKNSKEPISNKVFRNKVKVDNLIVKGDAQVSGLFGGVDLDEFVENRITLSGDQTIEGDLWLEGGGAENVEISGLVNGVDITEFAKNVMSKTKDQVVTAPKEFTDEVEVNGPITTENGINGVDLSDLNRRAFKLEGDNIVTASLEFDEISVQDLRVDGLINGVNLTHLSEDSLKKTGVQYVTGDTVFKAGFYVQGDINADTVNYLNIREDVLLKNVPQTIPGKFTFGDLTVNGNIEVSGLVNGLDLSEVAKKLAKKDEKVIVSNVSFSKPIRIFQDIEVSGLVNGLDLKHLHENVLLKTGNQVITGHKVLKGSVTIAGDVEVDYVNGVNWKQFVDDVVRTDRPQKIRFPKHFASNVFARDVKAGEVHADLINGKDLQSLIDDAVFIDVPAHITGPKTFTNDVEISGDLNAELINGLRLKTDVVTLDCSKDVPQVITGQKTFGDINALGDIHVGGTVNSYNLYELYSDTLLTEGDQTITGTKILNGETHFMSNVHANTVNGMSLRNELVTLDTNQEIYGPVTFNGDVYVEKDLIVNGLINDVNFTKLAAEAIYLDTNQTIEGSYSFQRVVSHSDVQVSGTVNGLDLRQFQKNVSEFWAESEDSLEGIRKHSKDNCEMVAYLQNALSKSYYILDSFIHHQELMYPASYVQALSSKEISTVFLDETLREATKVLHVWNPTSMKFVSGKPTPVPFTRTSFYKTGQLEITVNFDIYHTGSHVIINGQAGILQSAFVDASVVIKERNEALVALLYPERGLCEIFRVIWNVNSQEIVIETEGPVTVGKDSFSVAAFNIGNATFLALSRYNLSPYARGFCKIYSNQHDGTWKRAQTIPVAVSNFVKHFFYHGYHYVAFVNVAPVHVTREPKSIQIYRNSGPNDEYFSLFQKVPFVDSKGLEIFEFGDLSEMYLIAWNETLIEVFKLEGEAGLKSSFTLSGKCIKEVRPLLIDGDVYLFVGQQNLQNEQPVASVLYRGLVKGARYSPRSLIHCRN